VIFRKYFVGFSGLNTKENMGQKIKASFERG